MLSHNSTLAKSEPDWSDIDKSLLSRNAYADMGDPDVKSSFRYPHHHVVDGTTGGKHGGVFVKGNMFLHRGGLKVALQAAGGAYSGKKESNPAVKKHLSFHADSIGMSKKETAALLNVSIESLKAEEDKEKEEKNKNQYQQQLNNNMGGEKLMGITYEELEAKVKTLETSISEKDGIVTDMKADAVIALANTKSLEGEITKYEKSEEDLNGKIDELEKDAKDSTPYVDAGKKFIEDTKAEIHKMSVQVDGTDYNKDLVDKQLEAFGTDIDSLSQFKDSLDSRRSKMLKTGEINPDKTLGDDNKEKKSVKDDEELGASLVPKHLRVVK